MEFISYPDLHRDIVSELLEGKFLLNDGDKESKIFDSLCQNRDFYINFFHHTFDYDLDIRDSFAYLKSAKTDEKLSIKVTIFLSILCYEIGQKTTNFKYRIEKDIFSLQEIEGYLRNDTFEELVSEIGIENLESFLRTLAKRNIIRFIDKNEVSFSFTQVIHLFFEFAVDLSREEFENSKADI